MRFVLIALVACSAPATTSTPSNVTTSAPAGDRDGDEIADDVDRCVDTPEDYDVWEDTDGCPDPDDDHDGVADVDDRCPYHAGDQETGCPENCTFVSEIVDCFLTSIYNFDGTDQDESLRGFIKEISEHAVIREVELASTRLPSETVEVQRARLEPVRARLLELGWPSRVKLVLGTKSIDSDPVQGKLVWAEITKQRYEYSKFRSTQCTSAGDVYQLAKPQYDCKALP